MEGTRKEDGEGVCCRRVGSCSGTGRGCGGTLSWDVVGHGRGCIERTEKGLWREWGRGREDLEVVDGTGKGWKGL